MKRGGGGLPITIGGKRYRLDPAKYFTAAGDRPPARSDVSDDDQMAALFRAVAGDPEVGDDGG